MIWIHGGLLLKILVWQNFSLSRLRPRWTSIRLSLSNFYLNIFLFRFAMSWLFWILTGNFNILQLLFYAQIFMILITESSIANLAKHVSFLMLGIFFDLKSSWFCLELSCLKRFSHVFFIRTFNSLNNLFGMFFFTEHSLIRRTLKSFVDKSSLFFSLVHLGFKPLSPCKF